MRTLLAQLRPLPVLLAAGAWLHWVWSPSPGCCEDLDTALVHTLADDFRLSASPSDLFWLDQPDVGGWPRQTARAWVLAQAPEENSDVYLLRTTLSREGGLLGVNGVFNVTDTFAADERELRAANALAAWTLGSETETYRIELADADAPVPLDSELTELQRWQWRLTWLQRYGQLAGLTRRSFKLVPPVRDPKLAVRDGTVSWGGDPAAVLVERGQPPASGGRFVVEEPKPLAAPGNLITWAVDRVRGFDWFGSDRMQVVKALAYRSRDWLEQQLGLELSGTDDMQAFETSAVVSGPDTTTNPQRDIAEARGPVDLEPLLDPAFEGEGRWQSLAGDPFVHTDPNMPNLFWTTFIRPDEDRKFSRVMIVLWDPSMVELHMMSGTEEPKSATGETGAGVVPDEHLPHLAAAFNGGFQGTHGNFGMAVEDTLYVPPKPYAATVARLENGRTGFGTWPEDQPSMPDEFDGFRQNLTPLIANGQFNPYGRTWWGGVPEGWEDDTQTVRSGLCRTKAGFVAYFYGTKTDAEHLARAMLTAECEYALHLDMNQGHTGLEFYSVDLAERLPPLAMPLSNVWQAEGPLERLSGYRFRGRRLFRGMQLMNFPRYIQPETRDFFYLTRRPHLPGAPITRSPHLEPHEGRWSTADLPQYALPPALARTSLRADARYPESRMHLLKVDPSRAEPSEQRSQAQHLASWAKPTPAETTYWWHDGALLDAAERPHPEAFALFSGSRGPSPTQRAAVGVDREGMLVYAEIVTGGPPQHSGGEFLKAGLSMVGASRVIYLDETANIVVEGRDLNRHPVPAPTEAIHLTRWHDPGFQDIFTDTPVVPRNVWRPLQKSTATSASTSRRPGDSN